MNPKTLFAMGAVLAVSYGCATQGGFAGAGYGETGYGAPAYRACTANFSTVRGGQFFSTFEDFPHLAPPDAINRIAASMHSNGYDVSAVNREQGTMSAMHKGTYVVADTIVPLHALVRGTARGGARVELAYNRTVAGSRGATAELIRHDLCKLLEPLWS